MPETYQGDDGEQLRLLYERPGFMIRRVHQIATSIFLDASAELGATTTQYGVLTVLKSYSGIDQITLARRLGVDRSTAGAVLRTLEDAGYVSRVVASDRRRRNLESTSTGHARLEALHRCAAEAIRRLLDPLTMEEATTLRRLLQKLILAHNTESRVPLID